MKIISPLIFFSLLNFNFLQAQNALGLAAGPVFTLKGLGAQVESNYQLSNCWVALQYSATRYNVSPDQLPVKGWLGGSTILPPDGITVGHVLNPHEGYMGNFSALVGWKITVHDNTWLGIGTGLSRLYAKRGHQLRESFVLFKNVPTQGSNYYNNLVPELLRKASYVMLYEDVQSFAWPFCVRLQNARNHSLSWYIHGTWLMAPQQLSIFQFSAGGTFSFNYKN